jgi:DNA-binding NarL/FixJ family response regulator
MVTEIRFPDERVNGLELIREARRRRHELKAVVFTAHDNCQTVAAAFDAGAAAYVLKNAHPDDLASAIRQSFQHSMYLPASGPVAEAGARPADESAILTRRETEILRLVSEGHSNAKLAQMLWVTEQTVKFHLSNIYRKLSVANRTEASRWAQIHGLLTPSQTPAGEEAPPEPMRLHAVSVRR